MTAPNSECNPDSDNQSTSTPTNQLLHFIRKIFWRIWCIPLKKSIQQAHSTLANGKINFPLICVLCVVLRRCWQALRQRTIEVRLICKLRNWLLFHNTVNLGAHFFFEFFEVLQLLWNIKIVMPKQGFKQTWICYGRFVIEFVRQIFDKGCFISIQFVDKVS